jgi:hypothetical protein
MEMVSYNLITGEITYPLATDFYPEFAKIEAVLEKTSLELISKHHTDVKTYYHGTRDEYLYSILKYGLGTKPKQTGEFSSLGGVYLTTDIQYANICAEHSSTSYNFKKVIVVCQITNRQDIAIDEDVLRNIIYLEQNFKKYKGKEDAPEIRKNREFLIEFKLDLTSLLRQTGDGQIPALSSFNRFFDNNKNRIQDWLYLFWLSSTKGRLQQHNLLEEYLKETKWLTFQLGKFVASMEPSNESNGESITFRDHIGFKGNNKIIAIYKSNWGKKEDPKFPEKWTVIYNNKSVDIGKLTETFNTALHYKGLIIQDGRRKGSDSYRNIRLRKI